MSASAHAHPKQATDPIARWLTSTTRHPDIAEKDWAAGRPAILRTGILYDAVRMPMELVHAAVWSTVPAVVSGALAEVLDGPVVCHPGQWYYAWCSPGRARCGGTRCRLPVAGAGGSASRGWTVRSPRRSIPTGPCLWSGSTGCACRLRWPN